jgi:YVTN family beta-propeller protein
MNKSQIVIMFVLPLAAFLSSCNKDEMSMNNENLPVTYDAVYVVNGESSTISVIDLASNKVTRTIDLVSLDSSMFGGMMDMGVAIMWPHHINLSPDKSKLAIALPGMDFSIGNGIMQKSETSGIADDSHSQDHNVNSIGNSYNDMPMQGKIIILDAVTGNLLKVLSLEGIPHNAVFSPDGEELWTALMMTKGKIQVFDANTYQLLHTIPVGQMPAEVTFSDDGTKVFVANGMSNSVSIIDVNTKQVIETIATGEEPLGAWPGMDGMMYIVNEEGQSICIINGKNGMMTDTVHLGFMPGMAVRDSMMNQMWVSDPAGGKIHCWTKTDTGYFHIGAINVGNGAYAMAFTNDGKFCYVTNQNDGTVSVADVVDQTEMMKITVGRKPNGIIIRYK